MRPSDTFTNTPPDVAAEAARRRTFAVISHPDAGKSTLTEALALHARVLAEAGTVHGRAGRKGVVSDWMEMERRRGISITAAALQFEYRETVINLLDTPGHADFSEDTYRVLAAVDSAVMLLDAARGVEAQTRKLFAVCRHRGIPIVTFVNKWDRPGKEPLALLDEIETVTGMRPTPLTWPVGIAGDFRGAVDRRTGSYLRMSRSAGGATLATEEEVAAERAAAEEGDAWGTATDELALLDSVGADLDVAGYHAQQSTPVLFGAALSNLGVHHLLDTLLDLAPAPPARVEEDGGARSVEAPFSGQVFKVQTGMDPAHRDRVAFLRVCSGRFDRGMVTTHAETGRPFATKYTQAMFGQERNLLETAYPGDIVGLVNATALGVGDTLYAGNRTSFTALPKFAPEHFAVVTAADAGRYKQFRRGVVQLDAEGVVQVLRSEIRGEQAPVLAAVGPMQFDVAVHRLQNEFGVAVRLERLNYQTVRRTTHASTPRLQRHAGVEVFTRSDGEQLALFRDRFRLATIQEGDDEIHLEPLVAVAVAD